MIFGAPASRGRVDERGRGSKIIDLQRIPFENKKKGDEKQPKTRYIPRFPPKNVKKRDTFDKLQQKDA